MGKTLIANATIFDATGAKPFTGDLLIDGNRIAAVTPNGSGGGGSQAGAGRVIDATGLFCMPGMTEGHAHLSFENVTATENLITPTPEEMVFTAARGAKALIDAGFTSAYGASEAKLRLGVAVRDEVNSGRIPGPRIRAAGTFAARTTRQRPGDIAPWPAGYRRKHRRLRAAAADQHDHRRRLQQPRQPEPARRQGLHLRRIGRRALVPHRRRNRRRRGRPQ